MYGGGGIHYTDMLSLTVVNLSLVIIFRAQLSSRKGGGLFDKSLKTPMNEEPQLTFSFAVTLRSNGSLRGHFTGGLPKIKTNSFL